MKKALIFFDDNGISFLDRSKTKEIPKVLNISEELATRHRVLEELSSMALENGPNTRKALWDFLNGKVFKEYEDINVLCEKHEEEIQEEIVELINIEIGMKIYSDDVFLEYYAPTAEDKKDSIVIVVLVLKRNIFE